MGYTAVAVKGISWTWLLSFSSRAISLTRTIVLARLLLPSQFGIYGIGLLVLALMEVITETGINVFLIQIKEDLNEYIDTAWIVSILRGIVIFLVILLSAPYVASFFNSSNATTLLMLFSIVPLIRGFINPSIIKFQKELRFDKELWFRGSILLFDTFVAITLVYFTKSVLSLAVGLIAGALLEVILSFLLVNPKPKVTFEKNKFFMIVHSGKWVTLSGIFNYLYHNLDNIVVGRILGTANLGLYVMAYNISRLPITDVSDVISKVTFPVYSLISGDKKRLKIAFLKSLALVSIISITFGAFLLIYTRELVILVLGQRWVGIVDVLKILVIFGVIRAISGSTSALLLSLGRQKHISVITSVSIIVLALTIIPFVQMYGIVGAGYSALIGAIAAVPFMFYFTVKALK
jgi:O-antigen/teichoic acid export membrane protein